MAQDDKKEKDEKVKKKLKVMHEIVNNFKETGVFSAAQAAKLTAKVDRAFTAAGDVFERLNNQEVPAPEDLDKMFASVAGESGRPGIDIKRRRALQNKYEFLSATPIREGLMAFGFECGDGWLPLLEGLFAQIDKIVREEGLEDFAITQVKEKYGSLRVYTNYSTNAIDTAIDAAEDESERTCEVCGQPGKLYTDGWMMTRCPLHKRGNGTDSGVNML